MNTSLLIMSVGLLLVLAAIERLAAYAYGAEQARWRALRAAIPAHAIIAAEMPWQRADWIAAFIDPRDRNETLQLVGLRPLSAHERSICLRWLRAEGFADYPAQRAPRYRDRGPDFCA